MTIYVMRGGTGKGGLRGLDRGSGRYELLLLLRAMLSSLLPDSKVARTSRESDRSFLHMAVTKKKQTCVDPFSAQPRATQHHRQASGSLLLLLHTTTATS